MTDLEKLRQKINQIDLQIIKLLNQRFQTTNQIAEFKKKQNIKIQDPNREQEIQSFWQTHNTTCNPEFITEILNSILQESRKSQTHHLSNL